MDRVIFSLLINYLKRYFGIILFLLSQTLLSQEYKHASDSGQKLRIPVVFHIVHKTPTSQDLGFNEETLYSIVNEINEGFNNVNSLMIDPNYRSLIANCNISFFIPKIDENCNSFNPITWHKTNKKYFNKTILNQIELMSYGYVSHKKFLNIWICDFDKEVGYAIYPTGNLIMKLRKDGIAINYNFIKEKRIPSIIHEIGHYLNLAHIWEAPFENNPKDTSCENDDGIMDTPKQRGANHSYGGDAGKDNIFQFEELEKICGDSTKLGNYQNFMDFTYQPVSMFTKGQKDKMRYAILEYRSTLLWKPNCSNPNINNLETGFIKDTRDNQSYKWVQIGNQKWMTENLNYKTANSKCYDNKETNCTVYGHLYNWEEANIVCPTGWRLPNYEDWQILLLNIGKQENQIRSQQGWLNDKNGTNTTGLNFLPSGYKRSYYNAKYSGLGVEAKIWLSTFKGGAYSRNIGGRYSYTNISNSGTSNKDDLLSCRCIEGEKNTTNPNDNWDFNIKPPIKNKERTQNNGFQRGLNNFNKSFNQSKKQ